MRKNPAPHSTTASRRSCQIGAVALGVFAMLGAPQPCQADRIANSKHNLSVSGLAKAPGQGDSEMCIFCHTSHSSSKEAPLWNLSSPGRVYTPYSSTTTRAVIGQPTGASKLCLSCHDGTTAPQMIRGRGAQTALESRSGAKLPASAKLGTDLSDDHPVSFVFDSALAAANGQLKNPAALTGPVRLDKGGQLQCTSCHDPHNNQYGKFLVRNNTASGLCNSCHSLRNWVTSVHNTSSKTWNGVFPNPWPHTQEPTVAANACENCHRPHSAGTGQRLLNLPGEESNCYTCHNANVASKNIQAEFNKASVHPIANTSGVHDPLEDPINASRHVECADCHNPHAANTQVASAPTASGALTGVKGISTSGTAMQSIVNEYELCFRCHADSVIKGPAHVTRQYVQTNTRLEFQPSNLSYHPVEALGRNPDVRSLISPWQPSSLMYCTDCHNNNQGPATGGAGPNGPHGSAYAPILERRLELTDFQTEGLAPYALCYKCHSRNSILADESFRGHRKHVVDAKTACTTCHDPHGVQLKTHLINFNSTYVTKSSGGRLEYIDQGLSKATCYLSCHGTDHNPKSY